MRLGIGLVVKKGKQFIDKWIKNLDRIPHDGFFVIDNGADKEVWEKLAFHPQLKRYLIQTDLERNQSRDYQKILEMARDENMDWLWNIDIDELVTKFNVEQFQMLLLNDTGESVGFPLIEMREDDYHYVMIKDIDNTDKHARLCHKLYRTFSHFRFNEKDKHGISTPHNCKAGETMSIPILHYGHFTKELRDEKRKVYTGDTYKDKTELDSTWLKEDIKINHIEELPWKI